MLPTLGEFVRGLIFTGPLLSQLVCDQYQHLPVELGDEAVISTFGYPLTPYEPLTKCMTSFYPTTADTRVQVDCADVETDGSQLDIFSQLLLGKPDYLYLAHGLQADRIRSPVDLPVRRIGAAGEVVRVGFFSDAVGGARGFSCTVRGVRAESPLTCGTRQLPLVERRRNARIFGGATSDENQWPWAVQVFANLPGVARAVCAGTLISANFVLTAAHCLPTDGSAVRVIAGSLRLNAGVPLLTTDYTVHPDFAGTVNDVAVVRLPWPQTYSAAARPVCLPCRTAAYPTRGVAAGWGQTEEDGTPSLLLRDVTIPLLAEAACVATAAADGEQLLCTSPATTGGATVCPSDSGGPLMTEEDGVFTQVGVSFAGTQCDADNPLAWFERIAFFLDFIEANTDVNSAECTP